MKMTRAIAKHQANFCLMTLAVENVSPFRKHVLEAKLAVAVKFLETHCRARVRRQGQQGLGRLLPVPAMRSGRGVVVNARYAVLFTLPLAGAMAYAPIAAACTTPNHHGKPTPTTLHRPDTRRKEPFMPNQRYTVSQALRLLWLPNPKASTGWWS